MSTTIPTTDTLFDDAYWQRIGAESGRRNEPRTPDGPATARTALQAAFKAALRAERLEFLDAVAALNKRRMNVKRHLHEVNAQAGADVRQAAAVALMQAKDLTLAGERALICDQFLQSVETITQRAQECDSTWRAENEHNRDRRIVITPTELVAPADVVTLPPDPFA